jgi:cyclopropane fatty-acyl-phospholipid synthase-like methyltransferase
MHPGAFEFVSRYATAEVIDVIEIGSRDINGSIRCHFPAASWIGLDLHAGPSVDVVCDAIDYIPEVPVDLVVIAEVFEHAANWGEILTHAAMWLKPGGQILITCAGPGREPHSAIDGAGLRFGEHYENITQDQLAEELHYAGFVRIEVSGNEHWKDTYAVAMKQK